MLTQLSTVKARLAILEADTTSDALLTAAITAVSSRFDHECSRTLARTENGTYEFEPGQTELSPPCYPIESVAGFEHKTSESTGWQEITPIPDYLIRKSCIISLPKPLCFSVQPSAFSLFRVLYTGGFVLPGSALAPGQTPLPPELEQAAIEQVAYWFQTREKLGAIRYWPKGGVYEQFADLDLLPSVRAVLYQYRRWEL